MRPPGQPRSRILVRIPPSLTIRIDPARRNIRRTHVLDARTLEREPVQIRRAGRISRLVEKRLHSRHVLRKVQVAVDFDRRVREVQSADGREDVVVYAELEGDDAIVGTSREGSGDCCGVVGCAVGG